MRLHTSFGISSARTLGVGNPLLIAKHGVSAMHCCPWGHTPSATPLEHCTALFCVE